MSWRAYEVTSFRICQAVGGGTLRNSALRQSDWSPLVSMCSTDGVTFTDGGGGVTMLPWTIVMCRIPAPAQYPGA